MPTCGLAALLSYAGCILILPFAILSFIIHLTYQAHSPFPLEHSQEPQRGLPFTPNLGILPPALFWMAFLAYQTPAAVTRKVGIPTAIPTISEALSPDECEAEVGAGLDDEGGAGCWVLVGVGAEPLDGTVEGEDEVGCSVPVVGVVIGAAKPLKGEVEVMAASR